MFVAGRHSFTVAAAERGFGLLADTERINDGDDGSDTTRLHQVALFEGRQLVEVGCNNRAGDVMYLTSTGEV